MEETTHPPPMTKTALLAALRQATAEPDLDIRLTDMERLLLVYIDDPAITDMYYSAFRDGA